ncbi:MAG: hypothetical protein HOB73_14565 [Planctomycetaceae bacterium]|nr:hypothetical protein [Planctomycetaceae bacterium]
MIRHILILEVLALLLTACTICIAQSPITTVNVRLQQRDVVGEVLGIDETSVKLQVGEERLVLQPSEVFELGAIQEHDGRPWIVLTHGEVIVVDKVTLGVADIVGDSLTWKKFRCPLEMVQAVIVQPPHDLLARDELLQTIRSGVANDIQGGGDGIVLHDGTKLTGKLTILDDRRLELTVTGLKMPVEFAVSAVSAMFFARKIEGAESRNEVQQFGFNNGSYGGAKGVVRDGEKLLWQTVSGLKLTTLPPFLSSEIASFNPWSAISYYRPVGKQFLFLHDIKPTQYRYLPIFKSVSGDQITRGYGLGRNAIGGILRVDGKLYLAGVGMVSVSRLTFDVPAGYTRFRSDVGIDSRAAEQGSVSFHVLLQGKQDSEWKSAFDSPVVRGGDDLRSIDIPLGDARRLSLVVDMADQADILDYANWINARFVK